jgi:hypothetical protein
MFKNNFKNNFKSMMWNVHVQSSLRADLVVCPSHTSIV